MLHHPTGRTSIALLAGFLLLCAAVARGSCVIVKVPRVWSRPLKNQSKLSVRIEYDRPLYFPGEIQILTISTTNPTSSPLEILDPSEQVFNPLAGECGGGQWSRFRTLTIQPGETITRTIDSSSKKAVSRSLLPKSVEYFPGVYSWSFINRTDNAPSHEVGTPFLETSAVVQLKRGKAPRDEQFAAVILAARLVSQRNSNETARTEHVIMITRDDQPTDVRVSTAPGEILKPYRAGSWARLATLSRAVTALSATTDRLGRTIRLDYTTDDGIQQTLNVDANRRRAFTRPK